MHSAFITTIPIASNQHPHNATTLPQTTFLSPLRISAPSPLRNHALTMTLTPPQQKIKVGVLGATGTVGQRFMQLLHNHQWFDVVALAASSRSAGKLYSDAVNWRQDAPIPDTMANITVSETNSEAPDFSDVKIVFSGLDSAYANEVEEDFAKKGVAVFSNAKCHRMDPDVPILIPTVNMQHLDIIDKQKQLRGYDTGFIVTNANCSTTAMTVGLKPIAEKFGIETVVVSTMQAISGAGYPGLSGVDILDNVVPLIGGEEQKMEKESLKVLGTVQDGRFVESDMTVSAMCNRVHVLDGHTECLSIKLKKPATPEEVIHAIKTYPSVTKDLGLPSAPAHDVFYNPAPDRPQPRMDRMLGNGFTVTIGRVRECNIFDIRLVVFGHNSILGAAGGSILNAELCVVKGLIN